MPGVVTQAEQHTPGPLTSMWATAQSASRVHARSTGGGCAGAALAATEGDRPEPDASGAAEEFEAAAGTAELDVTGAAPSSNGRVG